MKNLVKLAGAGGITGLVIALGTAVASAQTAEPFNGGDAVVGLAGDTSNQLGPAILGIAAAFIGILVLVSGIFFLWKMAKRR